MDIIERLEKAEGPSRELDAEIWERLGLVDEKHCARWRAMDGRKDLTRERFVRAWAPEFTESLDAALTLVPEGWSWKLVHEPHDGLYRVVMRQAPRLEIVALAYVVTKATPALALCLAALKARQQEKR